MRREIPLNNVKHDYICVLKEFIDNLKDKLNDELVMVYLKQLNLSLISTFEKVKGQ